MGPTSRNGHHGRTFLILVLFLLALSDFVARRLDAPTWVDVALIAAWMVVLPWLVWTLVKEWRSERSRQ